MTTTSLTSLSRLKNACDDLGIFGGEAAFADTLHVGRPNIGDRERLMARINDMLDRKWLTNDGPFVKKFEHAVADYLGVKHCIAICNGTVALEIAARAMGLAGEVIVPSNTFVATAHCLQWQEITPIFCDVDPATHCLDPARIEQLITPRTTGILGVHVWGNPCAVEAIEVIAEKHNLKVLYDASHAFGCSHNGTLIGNFGTAETFSFHATKFVNSFEGGAITTNDDELAEKMRLMRNFGFSGMDNVIYIGVNGKMSEPSGAMGLTSLESIDTFIEINYHNYRAYREGLKDTPGISILPCDESERRNYQYVVLEVDKETTGLTRDRLSEVLLAENVRARRYFYPGVHRMEPYRSYYPNAGLLLPETEQLCERVLVLPTGTAVDTEDVATICGLLRFAVTHASEIEARMKEKGSGIS